MNSGSQQSRDREGAPSEKRPHTVTSAHRSLTIAALWVRMFVRWSAAKNVCYVFRYLPGTPEALAWLRSPFDLVFGPDLVII
jgi:hypothetical protein